MYDLIFTQKYGGLVGDDPLERLTFYSDPRIGRLLEPNIRAQPTLPRLLLDAHGDPPPYKPI